MKVAPLKPWTHSSVRTERPDSQTFSSSVPRRIFEQIGPNGRTPIGLEVKCND